MADVGAWFGGCVGGVREVCGRTVRISLWHGYLLHYSVERCVVN